MSAKEIVPPIPEMTLRDWFAGQALVGVFSACDLETNHLTHGWALAIAEQVYMIADAMMERKKNER